MQNENYPFLECGFGPNSTPKASLKGEGCPPVIYSIFALSLAHEGLGFFPIHPLTPSTVKVTPLIYSILALSLTNVGLGFSLISLIPYSLSQPS